MAKGNFLIRKSGPSTAATGDGRIPVAGGPIVTRAVGGIAHQAAGGVLGALIAAVGAIEPSEARAIRHLVAHAVAVARVSQRPGALHLARSAAPAHLQVAVAQAGPVLDRHVVVV